MTEEEMVPRESRQWQCWSGEAAVRTAPRPARTEILEAELAHGETEYVRAGHAEWEDSSSPRFVRRWRVYYP